MTRFIWRRLRRTAFQVQSRNRWRSDEAAKKTSEPRGQSWKHNSGHQWHGGKQSDRRGEKSSCDNSTTASMKTLQSHPETSAVRAAALFLIQQPFVHRLRDPMLGSYHHRTQRHKICRSRTSVVHHHPEESSRAKGLCRGCNFLHMSADGLLTLIDAEHSLERRPLTWSYSPSFT